jgi:hypothetical protein
VADMNAPKTIRTGLVSWLALFAADVYIPASTPTWLRYTMATATLLPLFVIAVTLVVLAVGVVVSTAAKNTAPEREPTTGIQAVGAFLSDSQDGDQR